jgi:hypothetical protein
VAIYNPRNVKFGLRDLAFSVMLYFRAGLSMPTFNKENDDFGLRNLDFSVLGTMGYL